MTKDSARVVVKAASTEGRLLRVATNADFDGAVDFAPDDRGDRLLRFDLDGLEPNRRYYYALENDGSVGDDLGTFQTFPDGAGRFRMCFGSCARTGSTHRVFDTIRSLDPTLFLVAGDLHYQDIAQDDPGAYRQAYDLVFGSAEQAALYRSAPVAYIWDDHDFGRNDSTRTSPGRDAAQAIYRERVPHYPLAESGGPIHQAFDIGRVRVVMTDLRSRRDPSSVDNGRSMMGGLQRKWLLDELRRSHETHALTIWVSSVAWISGASDTDSWGGYDDERREIARSIESDGLDRILMLSGDAHMVAIDDGANNRYGRRNRPGFPVFHASAFDRPGSVKGGPYSEGTTAGGGHFGVVDVDDDGGREVRISLEGRDADNRTIMTHSFTVEAPTLL